MESQIDFNNSTVLANQIILSTAKGNNCASSPSSTWYVGKLSGIMGDANNDGRVNAADINCIINYLLEKDAPELVVPQANINQDQIINIADVVKIINVIKNNNIKLDEHHYLQLSKFL